MVYNGWDSVMDSFSMINLVVPQDRAHFIARFVRLWGGNLQGTLKIVTYEELDSIKFGLSAGTLILSDLHLASKDQVASAKSLAAGSERAGFRVLNRLADEIPRESLFQQLVECGMNPLRVYELDEEPEKFPVFVREEEDRIGPVSGPLFNQVELQDAINQLVSSGREASTLKVAEYISSGKEGEFTRIHSAFRIGDSLIERGRFKREQRIEITEEETFYERDSVQFDQLKLQLMRVFELANVDYGRIDYAFVDDKISVWEIITNPAILPRPRVLGSRMKERAWEIADKFCAALDGVDDLRQGNFVFPLQGPYRFLSGGARVTIS
jgi:hypothetical protein